MSCCVIAPMPLQGPIVVVAETPARVLVQGLVAAGASPVVETRLADAPAAIVKIRPSGVVVAEPYGADAAHADALAREVARSDLVLPVFACVADDAAAALPEALPIAADMPVERLVARLGAMLRLRALHATVTGRAKLLKAERNIIAELPAADALDHATVLVVGRGRSYPALSVAVGERMGVMGALSVDFAARCLNARDVDGIVIGDGLPLRSVEAFLTVLGEDARFRDMPLALLGTADLPDNIPNVVRSRDPLRLVERMLPLVRMHAFEAALKRLLKSIESKGMLDAETGLLGATAFGQVLSRAIDDAGHRGVALSLARFSFEQDVDRRSSFDAARLTGRLIRDFDFASRQDDGSILVGFVDTDLRHAHVAARRLASVLRHTMLRPNHSAAQITPSVTLAMLKPNDTLLTLLARVAPRRVAAE